MYQASSTADGIFSAYGGSIHPFGAQKSAFADGALGEYQYGARTSSYADGSLGGCQSCSGLGADLTAAEAAAVARKIVALQALKAQQEQQASMMMAPPPSNLKRNLMIGAGVLGVGAIVYVLVKGKKG